MHGKRDLIRPGAWWCMCCGIDLYQISDEEEAEEVRGYWDDGVMTGVWETEETARAVVGTVDDPK